MSVVQEAGSHVKSWVKTTLGAVFGLLSGAVVMWFSPLIDNFVKPAKPIANFAFQPEGLTVNFENRSSGGHDACWDFGDGSPLEFVPAEHPSISHVYKKPGRYMVKLTVRNILEERNERQAAVELEDPAKTPPVLKADGAKDLPARPEIYDLSARPLAKDSPSYAPATFVFDAAVDNAQHVVWDFGDGQGLQFGEPNRTWTFNQPGTYTVRLAAFNGKIKNEAAKTITVQAPPANALMFTLRVVEDGAVVSEQARERVLSKTMALTKSAGRDSLSVKESAGAGAKIVAAEIMENLSKDVKDVVCTIAKDGQSVILSGTVAPPLKMPSSTQPMALLSAKVRLVEEKACATHQESERQTVTLDLPGQRQLRLPAAATAWKDKKRKYVVELRQGDKLLWEGDKLPQDTPLAVGGKTYRISAAAKDNFLEIVAR